jgi:hypothetical protein
MFLKKGVQATRTTQCKEQILLQTFLKNYFYSLFKKHFVS